MPGVSETAGFDKRAFWCLEGPKAPRGDHGWGRRRRRGRAPGNLTGLRTERGRQGGQRSWGCGGAGWEGAEKRFPSRSRREQDKQQDSAGKQTGVCTQQEVLKL